MVDKMDGEDKKSGFKKRSKFLEANMVDSDDDEPIGSLLKLKRQRNPKKVKPRSEGGGERGQKIEDEEEYLGGLDDTLASLRKKLKGPKKDSGTGTMRGRSFDLDGVQSLDRSSNGHVDDGGLDAKSVSRVLEKGPVMGDDGSDVTIDIGVENKLNGNVRGKRPKISRSMRFGEGSNSSLDHHLRDSLPAFSRKSQSGLVMNSRASSRPKEKSGSKVLEEGLKPSVDGVAQNTPLSDSNSLDSASDHCKADESQSFDYRLCQASNLHRENQETFNDKKHKRPYKIVAEDRAPVYSHSGFDSKLINNEAIVAPSGSNFQEGPCSSDEVNDGDSKHLTQQMRTFEDGLKHCSIGGSIQSKDVLGRCTSAADCETSSPAGKGIMRPHCNDDLLDKSCENTLEDKHLVSSLHLQQNSLTCHVKVEDELDSDRCPNFSQHTQHQLLNFASNTVGMEDTHSNCNDLITYTKNPGLASGPLQEKNDVPIHDHLITCEEADENESCPEDTVSLPDVENKSTKLSAIQRVGRNVRKRRHGDMAYEGDADWDVLINDQGSDGDNSFRMRVKFDSSSSIGTESESGEAAAVSAGLKANAVGPVEKIKFKEILKRRGGVQDYLECRNQILALWNKDVSRILPLTDCGVTDTSCADDSPRASLIKDIYAFLDLSGYINIGIAREKDKAEPGSKHDYKILREKNFEEISGVSVADSEDGVSFIIGQVKSSKTKIDVKSGVIIKSNNSTQGVSRDNELVTTVALELSNATNHAECKADHLENTSVDARLQSKLDNMDVSSSVPIGETLGDGGIPLVTPELKNVSHSTQCASQDHAVRNNNLQCGLEVKKKIIVIGAGPAGLTAARHLQRQGFSVTILEARSRIGGRVYTDRSSLSVPVDLGASIITGVEADWATERRPDPSSLVCAQLGLELTVLNSDCPLYDIATGEKVPADLDEALEAEFNSLLDDMVLLVAKEGEQTRLSLEEGLEYALKRRRMAKTGTSIEAKELNGLMDGFIDAKKSIDRAEESCQKQEVLSPLERRVMDWHFANLEYGCATLLKEVSLPNWNQDDVYGGFGGAHCMIKGGYSTVIESLGEGLQIRLNHVVTDVSYGTKDAGLNTNPGNKVKVSTSNGNDFSGDAVLVTVPLGCLKAETIKFSPPLPHWKHSSILRLGFGVLNKVVLEFPDVFWDDSVDYFGATAEETDLRGQCFMFWNVKKTVGAPVLIALVVGKAAIDGQKMSPSEHVNHALAVLRKLFGEASVPDPVASVVTDWGRDPFSYGAYSYVAVGASGEDYDILGRPVENCLFFAGEATCKEHPDTVGGAMMSGLREAVRIIDILTTGNDYTAEAEAIAGIQRQSDSERDEVRDMTRRLDAVELSNVLYKNKEALLQDMFFNAKTTKGRLHLAKELLSLPAETLKSFAGTKEGLTILNLWILDSMGKAGTQLLRHCVRLLVLVSTDLLAVRLSGIGKTVREKVCVHTSRDIRAIASQLVNVWLEVFRKEKASNGALKLSRQATAADAWKRKTIRDPSSSKPPLHTFHCGLEHKGSLQDSASTASHLPLNANGKKVNGKSIKGETANSSKSEINSSRFRGSTGRPHSELKEIDVAVTEAERAAIAAAEAARAAALAAAEAYASSEAKSSTLLQLPKIPSFHKFARREQYPQMDEYDLRRKWSGGVLGRQDCVSEIDSRNCKVRDWSVDFSAACVNIDSSRMSVDNLSQRSNPNETASQTNFREHSGESAAVDSSIYTRAWVDTAGSAGIKDYHAIEMWQSQAAAADPDFFHSAPYINDEEDSNTTSRKHSWKNEGPVNESSVSQVTMNKESLKSHHRGADNIKQAVVDYVASLLMPLYKAKKIDREGYKSIMKKSATKVMELATDSEKAMAVSEFLDFKRRNKIRAFVDTLIERHMAAKPTMKS
ncbi:hypothetical protein ACFX2I_042510 [Malus domestica]